MQIVIYLFIYFTLRFLVGLIDEKFIRRVFIGLVDFAFIIVFFGSSILPFLALTSFMVVVSICRASLFTAFLIGMGALLCVTHIVGYLHFIESAGLSFLLFRILVDWKWFARNCTRLTGIASLANPALLIMGPIQSPALDGDEHSKKVPVSVLLGATVDGIWGLCLVTLSFLFFSVSPIFFGMDLKLYTVEAFVFAWILGLFFLIGLYLNFYGFCRVVKSGRSAIGLPTVDNFRDPFASTSFKDFWRRWHISLGKIVNQSLFAQLAVLFSRYIGSFGGASLATLICFLVLGVWHGPKLEFVLFGAIHGTMVGLESLLPVAVSQFLFWLICPLSFYVFALGVS